MVAPDVVADARMSEAPDRPIRTAAIANLGCKVNQSEMEGAARRLRERGIAIVDGDRPADLVLVNTCTVTAGADAKSRQAVRRARRSSPHAALIVTGCSVEIDRAALASADPDALLVGNREKDALLAELDRLLRPADELTVDGSDRRGSRVDRALPTLSGVEIEGTAIDGITDDRAAVERTRAFIKVQDGCSFFCTYCIIPAARGTERSLSPDAILADVRRAIAAGHREIVLTGINLGTYDGGWSERGARGAHRRSALTLAGLVRRLLDETGIERIRMSSIEPQHLDDDLLRTWSDGAPRTMPHVHLPLQSGADDVLRRMGRRYTSTEYAAVVDRARDAITGVAVHGDVIVGFPTEDDAAWQRSLAFIRAIGFAGIHVFRYSARPGTAATRMAGHVDETTKKRRAGELLAIAAAARQRWARGRVGGRADVLFEQALGDGRWSGHAADHTLVAVAPDDPTAILENAIGHVAIDGIDPSRRDRVAGRILSLSLPPPVPSPEAARPPLTNGASSHAR